MIGPFQEEHNDEPMGVGRLTGQVSSMASLYLLYSCVFAAGCMA
jgi:hypothetical protein